MRVALIALVIAGSAWNLGCATRMGPMERQSLETRVYHATYESTYAAARDAVMNLGWEIESADRDGGILVVSRQVRARDPRKALTLSILLPTAGDAYMDRYAWAVFDAVTWPWSIIWSAPSNLLLARRRTREATGTLVFEAFSLNATRIRTSLVRVGWDSETYATRVRRLQQEIDRQLFLRKIEVIGGRR